MKLFQNKITRFLTVSLILVALLCVGVFSFLAMYMNGRSAATINEVGTFYMSSMSEQISLHFETATNVRLEQMQSLVNTVDSNRVHEDQEQRDDLTTYARALGFASLGFYTSRNDFDMIYGPGLSVVDPEPFMTSLANGEKKVAVGTDAHGHSMILMGIPAVHDPTPEYPCVALVGALPMDYVNETLSLEENSDHVYSFIIRQNGSFVVRSSGASRASYFDRVLALYDSVGDKTPQEYIDELTAAMAENREYTSEFIAGGERRHLYCRHLASSEWYLLTFMPYNTMDSIVNNLSAYWVRLAIMSCGCVVLALLFVFIRYFRLTHEQMEALDKTRRDAERATRAKSEFLSNMSHDIRTPMNAIVGMTAIAAANIDDKEQVQGCLKKISLSSKHLLGLINDVLDMSKIESGKMVLTMEQVSLREVTDGIVNIAQPQLRSKNQQFNISIHDISAEHVYCDSVRLNQVLLNLLSNAIKFTPEGGTISLSLYEEASDKGEDFVRVHVLVADTGIGMTPEFQKHIFESFTREDSSRVHRTEGTGLGMAITKYIVDAMGGDIQVQSELGQGSTFHITLDLERADLPESEMILPQWNMLVVDDDRQLCESAVASLQSIGVNAEWTLDGESAVTLVKARHHAPNAFHIILLDWKLPGIDGIETARRLHRELGDDVPILLISAYDWAEIETEARAAGISGFISKPLFKSTLYHGLKAFAGETQVPGEAPEESMEGLSGRRLLLAEDNELNWEVAQALLTEELGLELEWAENGKVCLEKFEQSPVGYYEAILMDLRMPVMTGYEATQAIRDLDRPDKDLPIIAMTADAFAEDIKKCLAAGMNGHVSKPISVLEVGRLLLRLLQENQAG